MRHRSCSRRRAAVVRPVIRLLFSPHVAVKSRSALCVCSALPHRCPHRADGRRPRVSPSFTVFCFTPCPIRAIRVTRVLRDLFVLRLRARCFVLRLRDALSRVLHGFYAVPHPRHPRDARPSRLFVLRLRAMLCSAPCSDCATLCVASSFACSSTLPRHAPIFCRSRVFVSTSHSRRASFTVCRGPFGVSALRVDDVLHRPLDGLGASSRVPRAAYHYLISRTSAADR